MKYSAFELENHEAIQKYVEKIRSEEGEKIYNRRIGKEHVNANMKTQKGYFMTRYRGITKVQMDLIWVALAHNIMKYCQIMRLRMAM